MNTPRAEGMERAARVHELRTDAGMTIAALARLMGVTRQTIHNWETAVHPMTDRDMEYMKILLMGREVEE